MKKNYFVFILLFFSSLHLFAVDGERAGRVLRSSGSAVPIASQEKCTICRCDIDILGLRKHTSLPCSHMFHTSCLARWLQRGTCPICRVEHHLEVDDSGDILVSILPFLLEQGERYPEMNAFLQDEGPFDSRDGLFILFIVFACIFEENLDSALITARGYGNQDLINFVMRLRQPS